MENTTQPGTEKQSVKLFAKVMSKAEGLYMKVTEVAIFIGSTAKFLCGAFFTLVATVAFLTLVSHMNPDIEVKTIYKIILLLVFLAIPFKTKFKKWGWTLVILAFFTVGFTYYHGANSSAKTWFPAFSNVWSRWTRSTGAGLEEAGYDKLASNEKKITQHTQDSLDSLNPQDIVKRYGEVVKEEFDFKTGIDSIDKKYKYPKETSEKIESKNEMKQVVYVYEEKNTPPSHVKDFSKKSGFYQFFGTKDYICTGIWLRPGDSFYITDLQGKVMRKDLSMDYMNVISGRQYDFCGNEAKELIFKPNSQTGSFQAYKIER